MPTWVEAWKMARASAAQRNGTFGDAQIPRVTNQEAASLLRLSMRVATQNKFPAELTAPWYALTLALAGWRAPGDKFLVDKAHREAKFPDQFTAELWQVTLNVAAEAQNRGIPFSAPTMDPPADYKLMLNKAWERMLAERGTSGPIAMPTNASSPATSPASSPDEDDDSEDGGAGLLLLLALFVLGKGKV